MAKRTVRITLTKTTGFNGTRYWIKVYHNGAVQDQVSARDRIEAGFIYQNAVKNYQTICTEEPIESYTAEI